MTNCIIYCTCLTLNYKGLKVESQMDPKNFRKLGPALTNWGLIDHNFIQIFTALASVLYFNTSRNMTLCPTHFADTANFSGYP